MIIINGKILKILLLTFILIISVGIVSADDNVNGTDNFKDIIDNSDSDTVKLDEKTYHLNPESETHITLNRSITVEGIRDKTVIDGNDTSLFLDVNQTESDTADNDDFLVIKLYRNGYELKSLGKNITFKNITFMNLKLTTWHEMKFIDCKFINTTFSSYEYNNHFTDCIFNNSKIEIVLFYGYGDIYKDYSTLINCELEKSIITYKGVYTPSYIELDGSDRYVITNSMALINTSFKNSNIRLNQVNITILNSKFKNTPLDFHSSSLNISNITFDDSKIGLGLSKITIDNSNISDAEFGLHASYYNVGCDVNIKNSNLNNIRMEVIPTFGSRQSSLKMENLKINNISIKTYETNVLITASEFNNSKIELFISDMIIKDSTFNSNGTLSDTIKTKDYTEYNYFFLDEEMVKVPIKTNYTVENSYFINSTGKYQIKAEDINMDTSYQLTIEEKNIYYLNGKLIIKLTDHDGKAIEGREIFIKDMFNYKNPIPSVITDANGTASYTLDELGLHELYVYYTVHGIKHYGLDYGMKIRVNVKANVSDIQIKEMDFETNTYSKIGSYLEIQAVTNESSHLNGMELAFKLTGNGKVKTYYLETDNEGRSVFYLPKNLDAGVYEIEISLIDTDIKKTIKVKIAKVKTTVKAAKITVKFKKSKYFKISVKDKDTEKGIGKINVKINVYTGDKFRTYIVKTNKKGTAKISTKKLKPGKHKVIISSGDSNYKISAKSVIKIKQ